VSPIRSQIVNLIDYLPEQEIQLIFEIVKRFVPDDVATLEDLADIKTANEEFARGDFVRHNEINWK
jgi:hypothetical protein